MNRCELCGSIDNLQVHHIFNGFNRNKSDKYKNICTMNVCFSCHRYIHDNPDVAKKLKRHSQVRWESEVGSHEEFMKEFRKNYL